MPNRRRTLAAAVTLTSTLAITLAPAAGAATATTPGGIAKNLTPVNLLNINDFHGHIDDTGLALACLVQQRRKALGTNRTMLLANGDNIGASPFVSASAKDLPTMAFLSTLHVRASSVGNHEFDKGLANILGPVTQHESFPTLGANVYRKGTQTPALPEYSVQRVNGVRVAVIGAVTADTPNIVVPDGVKHLTFGDPVMAVNRVATKLRRAKAADVIVAEYHAGGALSTPSTLQANKASSPEFTDIVTKTTNDVDVLITAHTHQTYAYDVPAASGTRPVIQSGSFGKSLAEIQLGIDPSTKKVVSYAQHNLPTKGTDLATCAGDATYAAAKKIVDDAKAEAATTGDVVIARQSGDLLRGEGESVLGNLDAQAWLDEMNAPGRPGADIGIMNPGGCALRSAVQGQRQREGRRDHLR